ncbi:MAG: hypothetical protein QN141_13465 [Armatimonadota bacterium]|nr:hypothetical protein [Armatimonadota bacterium]
MRRLYILPGVLVYVRVVPREDLEGDSGWWEYDDTASAGVISIARDLSLAERRYVLLHELQHALVDILDQAILQNVCRPIVEVRRRRRR